MLAVRERELKDVSGWGRFLTEARCRVNRCKLLARMGQPLETELAAAHEAVLKLRRAGAAVGGVGEDRVRIVAMTIWDWIDEFRKRGQADGDKPRLRLTEIHAEAWQYRETNSDRMIGLYLEGRHLAEQLREPWWMLFFDYWRLDGMIHWKGDYRGAHEIAIQNVLKSRTATYTQFPLNFSIQRDLANVYLATDPFGYEKEIVEVLDYLEHEYQPQGSQCYLLMGSRRAFAVNRDRLEEGREISLRPLARMDADQSRCNTAHYAVAVYGSLCSIDARRGDWQSLAEWAQLGETMVHKAGHRLTAAVFIMWQALVARQALMSRRLSGCDDGLRHWRPA